MVLSIKDAETDRMARRLARLTGESVTRAVQGAIRERLAREEHCRGRRIDRQRIDDITARLAALPVADDRSPDELVDYDEAGLPR